jgi:RNA methyltransferase, TrmH family
MSLLRSRDNPRVRRWHALAHDAAERRRERRVLLEGPHLVRAYLDSGAWPVALVVSESGAANPEIAALLRRAALVPVAVADPLFRWIADAAAPAGLAAEIALPERTPGSGTARHAVFLDGVQDAGNVGAILRSAAAFGVELAVLGRGCADAWSPKVLRAAMGGHFALGIVEVAELAEAVAQFHGKRVCAAAAGGAPPAELDLGGALAWIVGSEGKGVSPAVAAQATLTASVPLAPGSESLNVAAAAAILFYERARQLSTRDARS